MAILPCVACGKAHHHYLSMPEKCRIFTDEFFKKTKPKKIPGGIKGSIK
jgi:hypothetical protein